MGTNTLHVRCNIYRIRRPSLAGGPALRCSKCSQSIVNQASEGPQAQQLILFTAHQLSSLACYLVTSE
jgi:hypothetical protein